MVMLRPKKLPSERNKAMNPYDSDLDEFPWFLMFLEEDLKKVMYEPRIWEAFLHWSSLSEGQAVQALTYGTYPYINVKGRLDGPGAAHDHGHFAPARPDEIWIRRDTVQQYEKTSDPQREYEAAKSLEYLILHELVHWGRHHSGVGDDFTVTKKGPGGLTWDFDSGNLFGEEAYNDFTKPHM